MASSASGIGRPQAKRQCRKKAGYRSFIPAAVTVLLRASAAAATSDWQQ